MMNKNQTALFGGGCFWCVEAVFKLLRGVVSVESGYAGGTDPQPNYESVSTGRTGHAEVIRVEFDPEVISYRNLLSAFFASHDPTTLNRQGADVGTQYRSIILYTSEAQRDEARAYVAELAAADPHGAPIVTEIVEIEKFFPAEKYHQDYFAQNPQQRYCQLIIDPKVEKAKKELEALIA